MSPTTTEIKGSIWERCMPRGSTVYTVLRSRSKSGMSRAISVFCIWDGILVDITAPTANILGYKLQNKTGACQFVVEGCGLDVGYEVVTRLSFALYRSATVLKHRWI